MIYDTLTNLLNYDCIPHVDDIACFLDKAESSRLGDGPHPIRGDDLVLKVSRYSMSEPPNTRFESHRRFADIHFVFAGEEIVRTVFPRSAHIVVPYSKKDDVEFFSADAPVTEFVLRDDMFLYLAPGEIHQPCCKCGGYGGEVVKGVVKVKVG